MNKNHATLKMACYTAVMSGSAIGNLPALLFLTFNTKYGISYSLLGTLVLINFCTQLTVDLLLSFFSHRMDTGKLVKLAPLLTTFGFGLFTIWPFFFPQMAYVGMAVGTCIYSISSGLNEVLLSPVIAALPAEDTDREISKLHSVFAWGTVVVIIFSTIFLYLFGTDNWQILALIYLLIPITSAVLFARSEVPVLESGERATGVLKQLTNKSLWICFTAIFVGGAAELVMTQWGSSYLEQVMGIPKIWGDVFGMAVFFLMFGLGRSLYAKYGKNIERVLFWGCIGTTVCYVVAAVTGIPLVGLAACALTGFCASMLWPGTLIIAADRIPTGGVFVYAMMAAGGDLGASVAPQLVGWITDAAMAAPSVVSAAKTMGLTPDQMGMKLGFLVGALFPLAGIGVFAYLLKTRKKSV